MKTPEFSCRADNWHIFIPIFSNQSALFLFSLFLIFLPLLGFSQPDNYSGLKGKFLERVGGKTFEGEEEGATVTVEVVDDSQLNLIVKITLDGYPGTTYIMTEVATLLGLESPYVDHPEIQEFPGPGQSLIFAYPVNDKLEEGKDFTPNFFKVFISPIKDFSNKNIAKFKLNKKYFKEVSPENVVTLIKPEPIGEVAEMPQGNVKPAVLVIPDNKLYQKWDTKNLLMVRPATTAVLQPTATMEMKPAKPTVEDKPVRTTTIDKSKLYAIDRTNLKYVATTPSLSKEEKEKGAKGPGTQAISLFGELGELSSTIDLRPEDITDLRLDVYQDKNPDSGIFYYLPREYRLLFDEDRGFQFTIDYGALGEGGGEESVRMSGTLTPSISTQELDILRLLIDSYKEQHPDIVPVFSGLRSVPIKGDLAISFEQELGMYNITRTSVIASSEISAPMDVSWITTRTSADNIINALKTNVGIRGTMVLQPEGDNLPTQSIPLRINLADEQTLGRFSLQPEQWRTLAWKNISPYPVKLKYMHILLVEKKNGKSMPIIYSWDLGNKVIPQKSKVNFDPTSVGTWLDKEAKRIWLDYIVMDCASCHDEVLRDIVHSTTQQQLAQVSFNLLEFFDTYDLAYVEFEVRSKQADPKGEVLQKLPIIHATEDSKKYTSTDLYLAQGEKPKFEYKIILVTKEGQEQRSDWINEDRLSIPIGSFQLKSIFPELVEEN